ncbi:MAG: tripartite tricarboxylate transporter substrate binding protein [Pseudomonadota bacterium]
MNTLTRRELLAAASLSALAGTAAAQGGGLRPLRLVTTLAPGGSADGVARFLALKLPEVMKRAAFVDSRPGGNGIIGLRSVTSAPLNGDSVLVGGPSLIVVNPAVIPNLPYQPLTDLIPVARLMRNSSALVVAADSPIRTFADLVDVAKRKRLNYGAGSASYQVMVERIKHAAGFEATAIPYKGTTPPLLDVIGGQLDFSPSELGAALGMVRQGKLRMIVTTGSTRAAEVPNVPTLLELGYKDLVLYGFLGLFYPTGVPEERVKELGQAVNAVMRTPDALEFIRAQANEPWPATPDEFRQFIAREQEFTRTVVKAAGIRVE